METAERRRLLLTLIKDNLCGGVSALLAERIETDSSYVNRLFYEEGKNGGKKIGLKIMEKCQKAFALPVGFWEMTPSKDLLRSDFTPLGTTPDQVISHSDENNSASSLLLRLTDILGSLSPGLQDAAISVIAEAVKSPHLAPVHAVRLEGLLEPKVGTPPVRPDVSSDASIKAAMKRALRKKPHIPDDEDDAASKQGKGE